MNTTLLEIIGFIGICMIIIQYKSKEKDHKFDLFDNLWFASGMILIFGQMYSSKF